MFQLLTFGSQEQHTRKISWDICRIHGDQVKPGRHQCWTSTKGIIIPSLVPTTLEGCKYIDVKYELTVCYHRSQTIDVPFILYSIHKKCVFNKTPQIEPHLSDGSIPRSPVMNIVLAADWFKFCLL